MFVTPASIFLEKIHKASPNAAFNDLWTVTVSELLSLGKVPDKDFAGHCCELRQQKRNCQSDKKVSTSTVWNSSCLNSSILKYDGILHIPELNFFIPSPLDGVIDMHGLGGQKHTYQGIWDGILSGECVYHAAVLRVNPHPILLNNSFAILTKGDHKIGNVYSVGLPLNSESRSVHVNIYQIKKWYTFNESLKGSNMSPCSLDQKRILFFAQSGCQCVCSICCPER